MKTKECTKILFYQQRPALWFPPVCDKTDLQQNVIAYMVDWGLLVRLLRTTCSNTTTSSNTTITVSSSSTTTLRCKTENL